MKKLLLVVWLIFFLTPTFVSADEVKLSCKCFKHEFIKEPFWWMGAPLYPRDMQCSPINEIWIINYDDLTIDKISGGGSGWPKLNITEKSQESLLAHNIPAGHSKGILEATIKKNNDKIILTFMYDQNQTKKKSPYFKYSSSCKELQKTVKLDPFEAKQQLCGKLGFELGSQENGNCVLKIFEIESNLKQKQESSGGQLTEADKLIRQQSLNQSLLLMQQGLNLMSPPQPKLKCRSTVMGITCY